MTSDTQAARGAPELLPCPFCGSPAPRYQMAWGIRCTACDASVPCRGDDYGPWNRRATPTALAASPEVQALIETTLAALQDPLVVHLNTVAGKIAKPLPSQLVHIYGEDVVRSAFASLIREAEARGMERAADVVRFHGDVARTKLRETYDAGDARGNNLWGCIVGHLDIADDAIRAEAAALRGEKEPK